MSHSHSQKEMDSSVDGMSEKGPTVSVGSSALFGQRQLEAISETNGMLFLWNTCHPLFFFAEAAFDCLRLSPSQQKREHIDHATSQSQNILFLLGGDQLCAPTYPLRSPEKRSLFIAGRSCVRTSRDLREHTDNSCASNFFFCRTP